MICSRSAESMYPENTFLEATYFGHARWKQQSEIQYLQPSGQIRKPLAQHCGCCRRRWGFTTEYIHMEIDAKRFALHQFIHAARHRPCWFFACMVTLVAKVGLRVPCRPNLIHGDEGIINRQMTKGRSRC